MAVAPVSLLTLFRTDVVDGKTVAELLIDSAAAVELLIDSAAVVELLINSAAVVELLINSAAVDELLIDSAAVVELLINSAAVDEMLIDSAAVDDLLRSCAGVVEEVLMAAVVSGWRWWRAMCRNPPAWLAKQHTWRKRITRLWLRRCFLAPLILLQIVFTVDFLRTSADLADFLLVVAA